MCITNKLKKKSHWAGANESRAKAEAAMFRVVFESTGGVFINGCENSRVIESRIVCLSVIYRQDVDNVERYITNGRMRCVDKPMF
jgi:hypothetical protein